MERKVKILFLATNPKNSDELRLDEEVREIQNKIRAAEFRDGFELQSRWAVRPLDLLQALNEVQPDIVHFSGHGTPGAELVLEDESGNATPVTEAALAQLFKNVGDNVRLVVLNACHSEVQARAISQHVECTVGMQTEIGDEAAIVFASSFYGALAFGRSVAQAYEQGRTGLMLQGIPEENTPVLLARPGIDALRVEFVNRKPTNPVLPPLAFEIVEAAISGNTPINMIRDDSGVAVVAGTKQWSSELDMERAAALEHAVTMLIQVGWLVPRDDDLHYVTHAAYEAIRRRGNLGDPGFQQVKELIPRLIAELKTALGTDEGKYVREFFVMSRRHMLGGSKKPRFILYEEDHQNLRGQVDILENHGFVVDVRTGNVPIYRMTEEFVQLVLTQG